MACRAAVAVQDASDLREYPIGARHQYRQLPAAWEIRHILLKKGRFPRELHRWRCASGAAGGGKSPPRHPAATNTSSPIAGCGAYRLPRSTGNGGYGLQCGRKGALECGCASADATWAPRVSAPGITIPLVARAGDSRRPPNPAPDRPGADVCVVTKGGPRSSVFN